MTPESQYLMEAPALAARLNAPDLVVMDCRFALEDENAGESLYRTGHIPGARYAHLNRDLSAHPIPGKTGRHPLPERAAFARTVSGWGIRSHTQVVVYDQGPGAFACRLWWMLRWMGHNRVAVLNGGYGAWLAPGLPVTAEPPAVAELSDSAAGEFQPGTDLTRQISASELLARINKGQMDKGFLLDARTPERFNGESEPIDPVAGHIPGALCAPFQHNLNADQTFKSAATLRHQFEQMGLTNDNPVVCYCGSGVTATHNLLALLLAGFDEPELYAGSWSEWITLPHHPRTP